MSCTLQMYGCDKYGYDEKIAASAGIAAHWHNWYLCGADVIILATFMILNLFIGVITSSMQENGRGSHAEAEAEAASKKQKDDE